MINHMSLLSFLCLHPVKKRQRPGWVGLELAALWVCIFSISPLGVFALTFHWCMAARRARRYLLQCICQITDQKKANKNAHKLS